jgi:hypothetical protein
MNRYLIALLTALFMFINGCKDQGTNNTKTIENKMYVYSNSGNTFYLLDYKTFEVIKGIQLPTSDTVSYDGMTISTNRDYLFFGAQGGFPDPPSGFAIYDIKNDKPENLFFTKLNYGIGYFIAAENKSEPGLVYVHFRDFGTYSIDLFEQKVKELINNEHDFDLDKRIYHSPDGNWTVVHKNWSINPGSYSELEFYTSSSGLHDLQFVLNQSNRDSISIYDFTFSKDNKLYVSYQLSGGRSRGIESYFGSYDLDTKLLYRSSLKFPWSLSGYYLSYSPNRKEVYAIGSYGKFYIINSETYLVKDTISLPVTGEQSSILIRPDDNIAFIGYPDNNSIFVVDLNSRQVIKTIALTKP